jgi:hypothetical protein
MSEVLNLTVFKKEFKEIITDKGTFKVPSDIPVVMFLELMDVSKGGDTNKMKQGLKIMYDIFKICQPELKWDEFSTLMTLNEYTAVINWLFADISVEDTMKMLSEAKDAMKDGKKKPQEASN